MVKWNFNSSCYPVRGSIITKNMHMSFYIMKTPSEYFVEELGKNNLHSGSLCHHNTSTMLY